jgi:predicted glycoside hydrolase/deacetylase ChbG (UPF0249 family)
MKRLIVNADDLGYSSGIDAGILRAHREGIVTSSTLMASAPGAVRAALLVRAAPLLDVGVHLVLTYHVPLSEARTIPSVVGPDGAFVRARELVGTGRARTEEVLREYRAQYARGRELLGREPTHVDTHHWVQEEPAIFEAYLELARDTGAAARSLNDGERQRLRAAGVRTPDRFERGFYAEHTDADVLCALLRAIASGADGTTELMTHPSEPDPELEARSSYAVERVRELASLVDPRVRATLEETGLVLSTFAAL